MWTNGVLGTPDNAIHFDGGTTNTLGAYIATTNSTLFNFTTNSFSINVWLLPYNRRRVYHGK